MKYSTTLPVKALPSAEKYDGTGPGYTRRFHVMAKPSSSTCNLDCSYCFYLSKEDLLHQDRHTGMSDEVLENLSASTLTVRTANRWCSPGRAASRR